MIDFLRDVRFGLRMIGKALVLVAFVATYLPARKASRTQPVRALEAE
jgi:ABC-type lipoprotein release transport system permease subunit